MASYQDQTTKTARIDFIKRMIKTNDKWLVKALVTIYACQTENEQASQATFEHNNVGFNGPDSEILSSYAQQYQSKKFLSPKQLAIARIKMPKYARQLDAIAQAKLPKQETLL